MLKTTLTTRQIAQLTGAPIEALEKKSIEEYQQNTSSGNEIYVEGIIIESGSFFNNYEGFITPANLRQSLNEVDKTGDIDLYIDSPGGSVFAASNMATQITKLRKEGRKVNAIVTGLCASAATYFLLEADESLISPSGFVMIHRSSAIAMGNHKGIRQVADVLEKFDNQYIKQVANLTGKGTEEVTEAVDKESWFNADEAVDYGLVGGIYTAKKVKEDDKEPKQTNKLRIAVNALSDFNYNF